MKLFNAGLRRVVMVEGENWHSTECDVVLGLFTERKANNKRISFISQSCHHAHMPLDKIGHIFPPIVVLQCMLSRIKQNTSNFNTVA
jgi:hypothetical protein